MEWDRIFGRILFRSSSLLLIDPFAVSPSLLVQKARKSAQEYMLIYEQNVPPTQLVKRVADVMQEYTQSG